MGLGFRLFVSPGLEAEARARAASADPAMCITWRANLGLCASASPRSPPGRRSPQLPGRLGDAVEGDHRRLPAGGFVAQFDRGFFQSLFIRHAPAPLPTIENVIVGPLVAMLSFVCSVGTFPWPPCCGRADRLRRGPGFLVRRPDRPPDPRHLPQVYGTTYTVRIAALMLATMILAALIVAAVFSALGLIPTGPRPTRADIFGSITVNYKLVLNVAGLAIFAGFFWLTARRGARDPVCGMQVDRDAGATVRHAGRTHYFCGEHCRQAFLADPDRYSGGPDVSVRSTPRPGASATAARAVASGFEGFDHLVDAGHVFVLDECR